MKTILDLTSLIKKAKESEKVREWTPIKSAPKSGKSILVLDKDGEAYPVFWDENIEWTDGKYSYPLDYFTHWQDLPNIQESKS